MQRLKPRYDHHCHWASSQSLVKSAIRFTTKFSRPSSPSSCTCVWRAILRTAPDPLLYWRCCTHYQKLLPRNKTLECSDLVAWSGSHRKVPAQGHMDNGWGDWVHLCQWTAQPLVNSQLSSWRYLFPALSAHSSRSGPSASS